MDTTIDTCCRIPENKLGIFVKMQTDQSFYFHFFNFEQLLHLLLLQLLHLNLLNNDEL